MSDSQDLPIVSFPDPQSWESWLSQHHKTSKGIWLQLFKKNSGISSVTYAEAVPIALCYGWIDSQLKSIDEKSYKQKFTPRGPKSIWSKINTEHVKRLIQEGKMQPSGMAAVEAAKADGRWDRAYDSPTDMKLPSEFLKELERHPKAKAFFETLNKTNKYAVGFNLHNAKKPETKQRRIKKYVEMFEKGEKIY